MNHILILRTILIGINDCDVSDFAEYYLDYKNQPVIKAGAWTPTGRALSFTILDYISKYSYIMHRLHSF